MVLSMKRERITTMAFNTFPRVTWGEKHPSPAVNAHLYDRWFFFFFNHTSSTADVPLGLKSSMVISGNNLPIRVMTSSTYLCTGTRCYCNRCKSSDDDGSASGRCCDRLVEVLWDLLKREDQSTGLDFGSSLGWSSHLIGWALEWLLV